VNTQTSETKNLKTPDAMQGKISLNVEYKYVKQLK
jgi:hypothetical protein